MRTIGAIKPLLVPFLLIAGAGVGSSQQDKAAVSEWITFSNRAGWTIKHPSAWRIGSCVSCDDPSDPVVFVTLSESRTKGFIMIEHLIDKPADNALDDWLHEVAKTTVLNPTVTEEWISRAGERALKVVNRNPDSSESEHTYLVHNSCTFAIRTDRNVPSYKISQQIIETFSFERN